MKTRVDVTRKKQWKDGGMVVPMGSRQAGGYIWCGGGKGRRSGHDIQVRVSVGKGILEGMNELEYLQNLKLGPAEEEVTVADVRKYAPAPWEATMVKPRTVLTRY